jgi:beta-glucosidase
MGSAHVTPTKLTSIYDALQSLFGNNRASNSMASIPFAKGYDADTDGDEINQSLIDEAVLMAEQPGLDVLVVCVGLPEIAESEGFDRNRTGLPKQHVSIVEALTKVHSNVVVVLSHGGIVEIPESFVAGTKAILDGYLLGQACGPAILDVVFGDVSPSGRLPETIPIQPDDSTPAANYFPGTQHIVEYREGLDVGYRYYDTVKLPVRFPFGHGLHYTNFEYKNLETAIEQDVEASKRVRVSLDVRNVGNKGAPAFSKPVKEVVQLYIHPLGSSVYRPDQELKAFQKIEIAPGETKKVEFFLDERSFAFYDIGWKDWIVEGGSGFEVRVGASSRDIRLATTLNFSTGREVSELARESYPPIAENNKVATGTRLVVDDETFLKRFEGQISPTAGSIRSASLTTDGSEGASSSLAIDPRASLLPSERHVGEEGIITRNTLLVDAAGASRIGSILMFFSWMVAKQEVKEGPTKNRELRMIRANLENVPLRSLVVFSQGTMTFRTLDVLIHFMNGKPGKALKRLFRRKSKRRNSSIRMQN